jgi:hypothetical protein
VNGVNRLPTSPSPSASSRRRCLYDRRTVRPAGLKLHAAATGGPTRLGPLQFGHTIPSKLPWTLVEGSAKESPPILRTPPTVRLPIGQPADTLGPHRGSGLG